MIDLAFPKFTTIEIQLVKKKINKKINKCTGNVSTEYM